MTTNTIKFFKETSLPSTLQSNSVYYIGAVGSAFVLQTTTSLESTSLAYGPATLTLTPIAPSVATGSLTLATIAQTGTNFTVTKTDQTTVLGAGALTKIL